MKEKYSTHWEEVLWTAYDYKKPQFQARNKTMKKYAIAALSIIAATAFAQTAKIHANNVEQYQVANPVDVVVTAKRPVAKKDAAPRKSKVSTNKNTTTSAKTTK